MTPRDIIVTIPKTLGRAAVIAQLERCNCPRKAWHYCVTRLPREQPGRMYFCHAGEVIGSLPVIGMGNYGLGTLTRADGSTFDATRPFAIRAAGDFIPANPPRRLKGFRGWRYYDHRCSECGGLEAIIDARGNVHACPTCAVGCVPDAPSSALAEAHA